MNIVPGVLLAASSLARAIHINAPVIDKEAS
jgi:hypothetical protein